MIRHRFYLHFGRFRFRLHISRVYVFVPEYTLFVYWGLRARRRRGQFAPITRVYVPGYTYTYILEKLIQRNVGYNLLFNLTLLLNIICLIQLINMFRYLPVTIRLFHYVFLYANAQLPCVTGDQLQLQQGRHQRHHGEGLPDHVPPADPARAELRLRHLLLPAE